MFLVLLMIGLPLLTSLIGFAAGWVFMDGWVKRSWSKVRTDIEAELPSLLLRRTDSNRAECAFGVGDRGKYTGRGKTFESMDAGGRGVDA